MLDNLTTTIVMVMVLRKLVYNHQDRLYYVGLIVISANAGGAFSPIGDVTTIMLWIKGSVTAVGVMKEIFLASLVAMVVPALLLQFHLHGTLGSAEQSEEKAGADVHRFSGFERRLIFFFGVGGLLFVPIFHSLTHLPPYMGILLVLGLLWTLTEVLYRTKKHRDSTTKQRVATICARST